FGVEKLIISGFLPPLGRKAKRASRSTENSVDHEFCENGLARIKDLLQEGYQAISLELTTGSSPIHKTKFNFDRPIALIIGDERHGISDELLELSGQVVHIEMFGQNSSMNVVQAANIALYEITRQQL
ncbi:MAG: TrmH family RNA methyltransferase, partial [Bacteroidia bacterium]|nr:TrmH family RNA methyltransferase [Bacteroidia bacterium]